MKNYILTVACSHLCFTITRMNLYVLGVFIMAKNKHMQPGWTRATFIVREEYLEKIKNLAYWKRISIKQMMDNILAEQLIPVKVKPRPDQIDEIS